MGAVVAAAAAARRRRLNQIVDTFRIAGATAPDRSRRLGSLALDRNAEFEGLVRDEVLIHDPHDDTWWLDEAAYVRWRDRSSGTRAALAVALVLAIGAVVLVLTIRAASAR